MAIQTKKLSGWLLANAQVVTNATKTSMQTALNASMTDYLNKNMRALQDGVYIGKYQRESWGYYFRCEPWQTTNIGITAADADAIVIQFGGYRLGISLDEPSPMMWGTSTGASGTLAYKKADDLNSFDGKALTAGIMASSYNKNDDPTKYALAYAYNYSKGHTGDPGGDSLIAAHSWWLPTMGDLSLIHQHFETINLALTRIKNAGKQQVALLQRTNYWSCCEPSGTSARYLNFSFGIRGANSKSSESSKYRVRPVTAF